jgi:Cu-Zn family superoxide dismutase
MNITNKINNKNIKKDNKSNNTMNNNNGKKTNNNGKKTNNNGKKTNNNKCKNENNKEKNNNNLKIYGVSIFNGDINGSVEFEEKNNDNVLVKIDLKGLPKNSVHGIHIHEAGDLSDKCMGACAHFNPYNKNHGGLNSKERHVGDLGNIETDKNGNVSLQFEDKMIKLRGTKCNIIGRSVVIHEDKDDCGLGNFPDSKTTGHSGARIACAVIGYSKKMFL